MCLVRNLNYPSLYGLHYTFFVVVFLLNLFTLHLLSVVSHKLIVLNCRRCLRPRICFFFICCACFIYGVLCLCVAAVVVVLLLLLFWCVSLLVFVYN